MMKFKIFMSKIRQPFDEFMLNRKITKLTNAIWRCGLKESINPKYTKEDAETLAIAILWNDADMTKKVLSYTDDMGQRIFPR